jgi:16S rRNA (guanine1516-N2)-methyltransferase
MRRQKASAPPEKNTSSMSIYASDPELKQQAASLAERTGLPVVTWEPRQGTFLVVTRQGLGLCAADKRKKMRGLRVDFTTPAWTRRLQRVRKEQLIQAMGRTTPEKTWIIDTTGGLGRDSFLLAAAGFNLRIFERNPVLAALLADGLKRAAQHKTMEITKRISLSSRDARHYLATSRPVADIIYLDPMFPPRKNSAKVKKELQFIQQIVSNGEDYDELFSLALLNAKKRVVVKRPQNGPWINSMRPSYSLQGKTIRFDIYLTGSADH